MGAGGATTTRSRTVSGMMAMTMGMRTTSLPLTMTHTIITGTNTDSGTGTSGMPRLQCQVRNNYLLQLADMTESFESSGPHLSRRDRFPGAGHRGHRSQSAGNTAYGRRYPPVQHCYNGHQNIDVGIIPYPNAII